MPAWTDDPAAVRPMLATTAAAPLESASLAYEPKYDGIRALVAVVPGGSAIPSVRIWSRLGNEKTSQFPELVDALTSWARGLDRPVLLDGEIVALGADGEPVGFQNLQGRIHLKASPNAATRASARDTATALIVFDVLRDGDEDVRPLPLHERRARLERLLPHTPDRRLRISEHVVGDGGPLFERAQVLGWEGVIAKRLDSRYASGRRSPAWTKLKLVRRQACVVGGWTAPRGSRPLLGALLLGVYDSDGRLHYVGHTGAGFSDAELGRVWKRLHALRTRACPFAETPRTNERPHWTKPRLVAEVKFTEWTADGKLRHPTYLGLRDDIEPESVGKEPDVVVRGTARPVTRAASGARAGTRGADSQGRPAQAADRAPRSGPSKAAVARLLDQLDAIEDEGGSGVLDLPGGERLEITNLGKTYFPKPKLTKGDLFRHYVRVASVLLPVLADRPLVMRRHPNGISGKPFYQHRAPDKVPSGVRVEAVRSETEERPHLVGGKLATLLYMVQLGSISQDPWFSRVSSQESVDHVAIDLDPPEHLSFARVLDVARWVHEELDALGAPAFPKTSGARGLHIYVPMPADTPYDAGLLFCQIVATQVAKKHPKVATVERSVRARGGRIYVDYLQNIRGKTLASAYSARATDFAGVSTPLTWHDIDMGVSPRDFTIVNFGERLAEAGDVWAAFRKSKGANLRAVSRYVTTSADR